MSYILGPDPKHCPHPQDAIVNPIRILCAEMELGRRYSTQPERTDFSKFVYFWSRVDVRQSVNECWEWKAFRARNGLAYGQVNWEGIKTVAHRVAFLLTFGDHIKSFDVMHKCDNPSCCNPNHLRKATTRENILDAFQKERMNCLTKSEIVTIRERFSLGISQKEIAKAIGVSRASVNRVVKGKAFAWL